MDWYNTNPLFYAINPKEKDINSSIYVSNPGRKDKYLGWEFKRYENISEGYLIKTNVRYL